MVSTRLMATTSSNNGTISEDMDNVREVPSGSSTSRTKSVVPSRQFNGISTHLNLLDMPLEIVSEILSYLSYKKIAQMRLVSHKVNDICMHMLNTTFSKLIKQTYNRFHAIKANMPRRESARRNHPLSCECDIIETCYMRLSLLQMTFGKHIEREHCCFFPGAILDEVYTILHYIKKTPRLERPYRVTDELFDLSTMAMEYFRDRIEPTLPEIGYFNKDFYKISNNSTRTLTLSENLPNTCSLPTPPQSNMVLRKGIRKIKQGMKMYNNQLSLLRNEIRTCKRKSTEQSKQITEQQKLLAEQQKQTLEYANRLDEYDKKNEEMARKFSSLLQELNKYKTELHYWRSQSPAGCCISGRKNSLEPTWVDDYKVAIKPNIAHDERMLNLNDVAKTQDGHSAKCSEVDFANNLDLSTNTLSMNSFSTNMLTYENDKHTVVSTATNNSCEYSNLGGCKSNSSKSLHIDASNNCRKKTSLGRSIRNMNENQQYPLKLQTDDNDTQYITASKQKSNNCSNKQECHNKRKMNEISKLHEFKIRDDNINSTVLPNLNLEGKKEMTTVVKREQTIKNVEDADYTLELVSNLEYITSHETKKARRVQKHTRYINSNSKRNK